MHLPSLTTPVYLALMSNQVIHTASPFQMSVNDNEKELLQPALQGTKGVLQSIKAYNSSIRRVVITSSFASIADLTKGDWPEHTYTEKDWNRRSSSLINHDTKTNLS